MASGSKPIGFYLKAVDELLNVRINALHEAKGINRLQWQVLNVLSNNGDAERELAPVAPVDAVTEARKQLQEQKLIDSNNRLSDLGKTCFDDMTSAQLAFRREAMAGIDNADYQVAIQVLQRMYANLDSK
jgi:DNA-binding MarR family transcriptional regulator